MLLRFNYLGLGGGGPGWIYLYRPELNSSDDFIFNREIITRKPTNHRSRDKDTEVTEKIT